MRWLWPAGLLLLTVLTVIGWPAPLVHVWHERMWPGVFGFWQAVQQLLPIPAAVIVLPLVFLALTVLPVLVQRGSRRRGDGLFTFTVVALLTAVWIQLGWGLNYHREPLADTLQLNGTASAAQHLELADYLIGVLQETAGAEAEVTRAIQDGSRELSSLLNPLGWPGEVHSSPASVPRGSFLAFDVAGSLFPLTLEAFTDPALLPWQQVAAGIHELSHVLGIAREDDATLATAIAGLRSDNPYVLYSVALDSFNRLSLPPDVRHTLMDRLPELARHDLAEALRNGEQHRLPALARAQAFVFGLWLRLQGSEGGVADYSLGASRLPLALEAGLLP